MRMMGRNHSQPTDAADALLAGQSIHLAAARTELARREPLQGRIFPPLELAAGVEGMIAWQSASTGKEDWRQRNGPACAMPPKTAVAIRTALDFQF
jgi:hypothetical protein